MRRVRRHAPRHRLVEQPRRGHEVGLAGVCVQHGTEGQAGVGEVSIGHTAVGLLVPAQARRKKVLVGLPRQLRLGHVRARVDVRQHHKVWRRRRRRRRRRLGKRGIISGGGLGPLPTGRCLRPHLAKVLEGRACALDVARVATRLDDARHLGGVGGVELAFAAHVSMDGQRARREPGVLAPAEGIQEESVVGGGQADGGGAGGGGSSNAASAIVVLVAPIHELAHAMVQRPCNVILPVGAQAAEDAVRLLEAAGRLKN